MSSTCVPVDAVQGGPDGLGLALGRQLGAGTRHPQRGRDEHVHNTGDRRHTQVRQMPSQPLLTHVPPPPPEQREAPLEPAVRVEVHEVAHAHGHEHGQNPAP